jgi:hypothetical protein
LADGACRLIVKPKGEGSNAFALSCTERRERHHHALWTKGPCAGSISPTTAWSIGAAKRMVSTT